MRIKRLVVVLVSVVALGAGCTKQTDNAHHAAASAPAPTVTVDEVDKAIAASQCQPVDANGDATRKKLGTLPGAVLLTDYEDFKLSELPSDKAKPLVFYCANAQCGASHAAASKAIAAGYTNVKVMPEGIAGWVKAGKKVSTI